VCNFTINSLTPEDDWNKRDSSQSNLPEVSAVAELESQLARLGNEKVEMAKRLTDLCKLMKVARNERQASPLSADHHVASEIGYWHDRIQEILK